jgi:hypothetical protein
VPVWGCFSAEGSGPLIQIYGRFTGQQYVEIRQGSSTPLYAVDLLIFQKYFVNKILFRLGRDSNTGALES